MRKLIKTLRADLHPHSERGKMIRSAGITAGLKVGSVLIAFAASLLYARALGPHGYGQYAYVIAWASLLTIPASLGLPQYLVREGAKAPDSLRRLLNWADTRVLVSGLAAGVLLACAVFIPQAADARWLFVIAAPLPLLNNLSAVRRSLLQAQGWIARSQWPFLLLAPTAMLAVLIALWLWQGRLYPGELVAAMTGAALLPLLVNLWQLRRGQPSEAATLTAPAELRAALPFMWLGMLYLINNRTDLIMLGSLRGAHDAGVYAVASRAAELVTFFILASNQVIAPRIARLYRDGDHAQLQRLLTASTRRVCAFSAPFALLLIFAAHPLLRFLYGAPYEIGAIALQILASAQLVNVAAGPTGLLLNMTGNEKLAAVAIGAGASLNVIFNFILIPLYGIDGAAMATGISLISWNTALIYCIRRRVALQPGIINF